MLGFGSKNVNNHTTYWITFVSLDQILLMKCITERPTVQNTTKLFIVQRMGLNSNPSKPRQLFSLVDKLET